MQMYVMFLTYSICYKKIFNTMNNNDKVINI
jgi:hypothetical protein